MAMGSIADFDVKGEPGTAMPGQVDARRGFESMYEQGVRDLLYGTGRETFEAVKMLRAASPQRLAPANGAQYPRGRFGESLKQIAQLVRADVGLEVAFADVGGWDTHAGQGNERGQLANRLTDFAQGLAALDRDLGDRMEDVVVLTMSEFGRTVRENGNRGTDHGHATAMLVLGGPVRGGRVHGRWPGLRREQLFEGRDLAVTTDFRQLFAEVAQRHLGVPAEAPLFPGFAAKGTEARWACSCRLARMWFFLAARRRALPGAAQHGDEAAGRQPRRVHQRLGPLHLPPSLRRRLRGVARRARRSSRASCPPASPSRCARPSRRWRSRRRSSWARSRW